MTLADSGKTNMAKTPRQHFSCGSWWETLLSMAICGSHLALQVPGAASWSAVELLSVQ